MSQKIFSIFVTCAMAGSLFCASCARDAKAAPASVIRAADFTAGVGVAVHINAYGSAQKTLAALRSLGVERFRVDAPQPRYLTPSNLYDTLQGAGLKATYMLNWNIDPGSDPQKDELKAVRSLAAKYPGTIDFIEGPNEVNNFPVSYGGKKDPKGRGLLPGERDAAKAFQEALYKYVKSDPILRSIPVIDYTDVNPIRGAADISNNHVYPGSWWIDSAAERQAAQMDAVAPGRPAATTEWGYPSTPTTNDRSVTEGEQAERIIEGVAVFARLRERPAFIYELRDEGQSSTDNEHHFGLFRTDWTMKPSGAALQRLLRYMRDVSPTASRFSPADLNVTVSETLMKHLVVARSDGSYVLLLWRPMVKPADRPVTVTLSRAFTVKELRPLDGGEGPTQTGKSFTLSYNSGLRIFDLRQR